MKGYLGAAGFELEEVIERNPLRERSIVSSKY
jgi:hypothetical protein